MTSEKLKSRKIECGSIDTQSSSFADHQVYRENFVCHG